MNIEDRLRNYVRMGGGCLPVFHNICGRRTIIAPCHCKTCITLDKWSK